MTVLLLRLAGPMQSWNTTPLTGMQINREPSKCGLVALLCAALGVDVTVRGAVEPLARLRMGVRVDREGVLARDFLAGSALDLLGAELDDRDDGGLERADGGEPHGHCLADAGFLVGLEGEQGLLSRCHRSLRKPRSPLYLGRVGYLPAEPVHLPDGLQEGSLEEALLRYPWRPRPRESLPPWGLRFVIESESESAETRLDRPLCLTPGAVRLGKRRVTTSWKVPQHVAPCAGLGGDLSVPTARLPAPFDDTAGASGPR